MWSPGWWPYLRPSSVGVYRTTSSAKVRHPRRDDQNTFISLHFHLKSTEKNQIASWDSVYLVLKAPNSPVSTGYDTTSVRKLMQVMSLMSWYRPSRLLSHYVHFACLHPIWLWFYVCASFSPWVCAVCSPSCSVVRPPSPGLWRLCPPPWASPPSVTGTGRVQTSLSRCLSPIWSEHLPS